MICPSQETPFIGWHRSIPQIYIERLIQAGANNQLSRFDLRVWCALAEMKTHGSLPMDTAIEDRIQALMAPDDITVTISFQRRRRKILKSWDRLQSIVGDVAVYHSADIAESFWTKVPRLLLRYLVRYGTRAEIGEPCPLVADRDFTPDYIASYRLLAVWGQVR